MGGDASAEALLGRPRDEVAAFVFESANDARWIGGIKHARKLDPGPAAVGSGWSERPRSSGAGSST